MNSPEPATQMSSHRIRARIAGAMMVGGLLFAVLWITMFSWTTSLLIGTGCCVVFVAASSVSTIFDVVLEAMVSAVSATLGVIAAIFGAILGLFGI